MNDTDFIGEIRYFGFSYVPDGWLRCDGTELKVYSYQALFAVIGTAYGGDGQRTFLLPDLRGRAAIGALAAHVPPYERGVMYGHETVSLTMAQLPPHTHQMVRPGGGKPYGHKLNIPGPKAAPGSLALADNTVVNALNKTGVPNTQLMPEAVMVAGASVAHTNLQPYQVVTVGICYDGVFPPRP